MEQNASGLHIFFLLSSFTQSNHLGACIAKGLVPGVPRDHSVEPSTISHPPATPSSTWPVVSLSSPLCKSPMRLSVSFFLFCLNLFIFNWRIIALQYCVGFCHISTWISHRDTIGIRMSPPSWNYLPSPAPTLPLGCHRAPIWAPCIALSKLNQK